eukprot:6517407-Pyramimonas_sp.AAC.2
MGSCREWAALVAMVLAGRSRCPVPRNATRPATWIWTNTVSALSFASLPTWSKLFCSATHYATTR